LFQKVFLNANQVIPINRDTIQFLNHYIQLNLKWFVKQVLNCKPMIKVAKFAIHTLSGHLFFLEVFT